MNENRKDVEKSMDETMMMMTFEQDSSFEVVPEVFSLNFVRDVMVDVSREVTANWEQMKLVDD